MSKKVIGWLYFLGLVFEVLVIVAFFNSQSNDFGSQIALDNSNIQYYQQIVQNDLNKQTLPEVLQSDQQQLAQAQQKLIQDQQNNLIQAIFFMALPSILSLVAWIGALINLSKGQQWVWFVLMFFFGGIMLFIYLIGGPAVSKAEQTPAPQQNASSLPSNAPPVVPTQSPLDVLQLRFARGEIDATTYQQMRDTLLKS